MEHIEQTFTAINEYINYHVDRLFGNSVKYKFMAFLNYLLTGHLGRMITGAILVVIGLMIRQHYMLKMYFDPIQMDYVQPTDIFYWFGLGSAFIGGLILGLYTLILFYNMLKNLVS